MRWRGALVGILAALGGAVVYLTALHPRHQAPSHAYFQDPGPWVVAHRGGAALAPENTMAAFRTSRALGVDVLEMDLRFTADGILVLMHDATVDRTTDGQGPVAELTLAELQALDAGFRFEDGSGDFPYRGAGVRVPAFSTVLREFPEARLNVEMKEFTEEQARTLCALLEEHDAAPRVLVSAFSHAAMTAFRKACPEVATGATRREAFRFYYLHRLGLGRLFRCPAATLQLPLRFRGRTVVTRAVLEEARAGHRPVQVWTVNDATEMRRLLELKVQAILTDRPDRLLELRARTSRPSTK